MFRYFATIRGIPAILIIAALGVVALLFEGVAIVRKLAWTAAALIAIGVAFHEWQRR